MSLLPEHEKFAQNVNALVKSFREKCKTRQQIAQKIAEIHQPRSQKNQSRSHSTEASSFYLIVE